MTAFPQCATRRVAASNDAGATRHARDLVDALVSISELRLNAGELDAAYDAAWAACTVLDRLADDHDGTVRRVRCLRQLGIAALGLTRLGTVASSC